MNSFRLLLITISKNLSWSSHISTLGKKAHKSLSFLWQLREAEFWSKILVNFSRGATESILTGNITNCHNSSWSRTGRLYSTQNITGTIDRASVTSVKWDVCTEHKDTKSQQPPSDSLFTLLQSDNRYRSICCCTTRLQSHFTPQTARLLNSSSTLHHKRELSSFAV